MREIKFRGIRVDNEMWIGGNLVVTKSEHYTKYEIVLQHKKCHYGDCVVEVYPESVGQFIGIVDRGGNDIYEGDIVTTTSMGETAKWSVGWALGIMLYPLSPKKSIKPIDALSTLRVVGNIHADRILLYREAYMG